MFRFIIAGAVAVVGLGYVILQGGSFLSGDNAQEVTLGGPNSQATRHVYPREDSMYEVGTSGLAYLSGYFDELCLTGAGTPCITDWLSGGSGGGTTTFQIDGSSQGVANVLDFNGTDFSITESPDNDFDITIASGITRDSELSAYAALADNETVTGEYDFNTGTTTINLLNVDGGGLSVFGAFGTAWSDFCEAITGGSGLCDGTDNTGGGGGGLATSTAIADTQIIWGTSASDVGSEAAFTYDDSTDRLTVINASTTKISATTFLGNVIGNLTGNVTGNADTATALASNGANCSSGNAPLGVDASGAVESCFDVWTEAENTSAAYISGNQTITLSGDVTGSGETAITTAIASDVVGFGDIDFSLTLAGNPALLVDECYFAKTTSGGGFICEGSTADTAEQLYLFPDLNGSDTTDTFSTLGSAQTFTGIKTISSNWVNTANPWADNEVADTLTIGASSVVDVDAVTGDTSDDDDLDVAAGGTGVSTLTGMVHGNGTSDFTALAVTTNGAIIVGDGAGIPTTYNAFTGSAGTLIHEAGGLEADVSAYTNGLYGMLSGVTADIDTLAEWNTALGGSILSGTDATVITGTAGTAGNCAEWDANGDLVDAGDACGTGGGGSGSLSTSTGFVGLPFTSEEYNYITNDLIIGGSATTSAEFIMDPEGASFTVASTSANASSTLITSGNSRFQVGTGTSPYSMVRGFFADFNTAGDVIFSLLGDALEFVFNVPVRFTDSLTIPQGTNPTVNATGELALNINTASTSLRFYDGSAEWSLRPEFSWGATFASSSLAYQGSFGASGSTTIRREGMEYNMTVDSFKCSVDTGSAMIEIGDGTASTTATCDGSRDGTNVSFTAEEDILIEIGSTSGSPNSIRLDVTSYWTTD